MDEHMGTIVTVLISSLVTGIFTAAITIVSLRVHMQWMRKSLEDVNRDVRSCRDGHAKHLLRFHTTGKVHLSAD